jgi:uncharacterized protein RhaS with RHS repeats
MRDYDPTTGRYIQADPLGLIDGASVYGYVKQNPGRWVDPRGEDAGTIVTTIVRGVTLFGGAAAATVGGGIVGVLGIALYPTTARDGELRSDFAPKSDKAAQAEERRAYKSFCGKPPQPTGDYCADLKAKLEWKKQCLAMRQSYGKKYFDDGGHPIEEANLQRGIERMEKELLSKCPNYCAVSP